MTEPSNHESHANEGYRAVGRYVVEFSRMVLVMRDLMAQRLRRDEDPADLTEIPFAGATADQITSAFFGMCRMLNEHEADEKDAAAKLHKAVREQIKRRNDVAHGDWYVGYFATTGAAGDDAFAIKPSPPWVERIFAARHEGPRKTINEDLDQHSEELVRLRTLLHEYGLVCLGGRHARAQRVRDVIVLQQGAIEFGQLANRGTWWV